MRMTNLISAEKIIYAIKEYGRKIIHRISLPLGFPMKDGGSVNPFGNHTIAR